MDYKKLGFVIADEDEFAPVLAYCLQSGGREYEKHGRKYCEFSLENGVSVTAVLCNVGKVNAAAYTAALICEERPDCIINFGLSGAVSGVCKHQLVVGESFTEYDFDLTPLGYSIGVKPDQEYVYTADEALTRRIMQVSDQIVRRRFVTGDRFVTDEGLRQMIVNQFGGHCCDMETAAIASVCSEFSVPFASLRYLSDGADDSAAESYKSVNELRKDTLLRTVLAAFERE